MILEVISNDPSHKHDAFLKNICEKRLSNNYVTMVTKMLHIYISVTVPDRPILTIIHR